MIEEEVLKELKEISEKLNLPIDNVEILREWKKRHPESLDIEVYNETIGKIFFPPEKCVHAIKYDSDTYKIIAVKKTKNSEWEYINQ